MPGWEWAGSSEHQLLAAAVGLLLLERVLTFLGVLADGPALPRPSNLVEDSAREALETVKDAAKRKDAKGARPTAAGDGPATAKSGRVREAGDQDEAVNDDLLPPSELRLPGVVAGTAEAHDDADEAVVQHAGVTLPDPVPEEVLTRDVVAQHVCSNDMWIVLKNRVLNVTPFLACHPGGANALKKWRGQDATAAFYALSLHTDPTRKKEMKKYFKMMYVGDLGTAYEKSPLKF
eukprot:TRINITY_DN32571_c0_g1_i1.p1 TRINITY_DN32571_c0_g1~~TRINITY_DN32571_c0_g1_i1.p1  ORF type:complete len:252 (+),score=89.18 TRINITY_DN32571_c0_g1_i1:57-758(+)